MENLTIQHVMSHTAFEDALTAEAALETLKWLEQDAPPQFDGLKDDFKFNMEQFILNIECNTVCCIAGAISEYKRVKNNQESKANFKNTLDLDNEFSLEYKPNLRELFYANSLFKYTTNDDNYQYLSKITPKQAAIVLRHYLTTGITNWKLAFPSQE